jgi:RNA recognition motif-containing protein
MKPEAWIFGFKVLSRRFSLHSALAFVASACCSDDLAIVSMLFHQKDTCVNIFVGNLAFNATDQDIRQLFEPYGVVDTINIITDRYTGQSRGFGFVEMPDTRAAQAAIQGLQGTALGGRTLNVNEAKPREPRREPSRSRW